MHTTTIPATKRYGVIIAGGIEAARYAVEKYLGPRPMRNVTVNGYGSVHCDVFAGVDQLYEWWAATERTSPPQPGTLCFYISK